MRAPGATERSTSAVDEEWDEFVDTTPGGHHVQTSAWGRVKALAGWHATRVILRDNGGIVGGAQVLMRRVPVVGSIAFVPRGPIIANRDPAILEGVLDGLDGLARQERVVYAKLQPPTDRDDMPETLVGRGFVRSDLGAAPTATVLVDLRRPPEEIFAGMRTSSRSNIRKAERKGVLVRSGGEDGLPAFGRLLEATSARQGFSAYSLDYYATMLRCFEPGDRARLLIAEHEGEPVSAALVIGYGDSAVYKMGAWSGERTSIHPNELLHWTAMQWARERGYRHYDLEGIDESVARAVQDGRELPDSARRGTTRFKLGLGGEVAVFPAAHDRSYRPLAGVAVRHLAPHLSGLTSVAQRVLGRGR